MQKIIRRIAVIVGGVAVSAGLVTVTSVPAHATTVKAVVLRTSDSSWGY